MGDHMFNYNPSTLFLLKKIEQMIQKYMEGTEALLKKIHQQII
jgi:hypothetical protein